MTKKHFEALARILRHRRPPPDSPHLPAVNAYVDAIAQDIAVYCGALNPNFNTTKFLKASGVTQ